MKFKGKVDLWFWIVAIAGEIFVLSSFYGLESEKIMSIIVIMFYNLIFLPMLLRNYVEVSDDTVTIVFGFGKDSIAISQIREVYQTSNPISSSAASLDRILIQGTSKQMMCAVQEKEQFFSYLKEKNPNIVIHSQKDKATLILQKGGIAIGVVTVVIAGILLVTGTIKYEYHTDSFKMEISYWPDVEIAYDEVESIEYREEVISGSRVSGFGSFRLLLGNFENEEFGNYTRYTYTNSKAAVVLEIDGRTVVIAAKEIEDTKAMYEELVKYCNVLTE